MFVEIAVVLLLLVANGLFSMSEMAIVSARRARLEKAARDGQRGAREALALNQSPADFLATVQIGITVIGILAGAFGGATIAEKLAGSLSRLPWIGDHAQAVSMGFVVVVISYLSLVIGELVPKRIALANPEAIAGLAAVPMGWIAWLAAPVVKVLSVSTEAVARLMPFDSEGESAVTQDEIRLVIEQGARTGQVDRVERSMIENIFRMGDRPVRMVMVPRLDVTWIDLEDPPERILDVVADGRHSAYPAGRGSLDDIRGVVHTKDLVRGLRQSPRVDVAALVRPPLFVVESSTVLQVLETLKASDASEALIVGEHSGFQGMVTARDIMESLVEEGPGSAVAERAAHRTDESWRVQGRMGMDELCTLVGLDPKACGERFETLGGFVMAQLGRVPRPSDRFQVGEFHFEVVQMDGRRVDRVLIRKS